MIELMVFPFDAPLDGEYGFTSIGSWCYSTKWVMVVLSDAFLDGELILQETDAILGDGYGSQGQWYVALLQGSEMSAGFRYKGLMLSN